MSHRYRLYPTPEQEVVMRRNCSDARFVWNLALEQCEHARRVGRFADQRLWGRELTGARQAFAWLEEGSSHVQKEALRDLRQAFRNWWKRPDHFGYPTWRKAGINEGFVVPRLAVQPLNGRWASLTVPKAGHVRFRLSRPVPAGAKTARVTFDSAGRWHVSIVSKPTVIEKRKTGAVVGVDVGVTQSVTTSGGRHINLPTLFSPGEAQRKRLLERQLSRQHRGSSRRHRTRRSLARLKAREADRRKDWIEKTTTALVRDFDFIAIEDLRVKNMVAAGYRKRGLNREIHNQAWGTFRLRLEQKAHPGQVVAVPAANTSRRCHPCGHTTSENRKSQAVFQCVACGHRANADVNAALNILAAGLAVTGRGGPPIRADEASTINPPTRGTPMSA